MVNIFWFCCLFLFFLSELSSDSIFSSGVEVDSVAFSQSWNVLLLFSDVTLSIRSFFINSLTLE